MIILTEASKNPITLNEGLEKLFNKNKSMDSNIIFDDAQKAFNARIKGDVDLAKIHSKRAAKKQFLFDTRTNGKEYSDKEKKELIKQINKEVDDMFPLK